MADKKRLVRTFLDLVKIDSLSLKERKAADYVKRRLKKLGLRAHEDNAGRHIGGDCGNIIAFLRGFKKGAPAIMLNAHLDTVKPGEGIRPRIRHGYIYSDGKTILGADNKAGVAVILEVIRMLRGGRIPHGGIRIVFTVAEEIGLLGARRILKKHVKADLGLVLDGGDVFEIIHRAPSQDSISAEVIGRAAHAGVHPEKGINAIKVASEAVSRMRLGRIDRETTANIGSIEGGIATNIVPEKVLLKGEARSHDPRKLKLQVLHMVKCLKDSAKKHKAKVKIDVRPEYRAFNVSWNGRTVNLASSSAKAVNLRPIVRMTGGGSDANIFNAMGIPTIILGAGADRVHTKGERASIAQMVKSADLVLEMIRRACNEKTQAV